MLTRNMSDGNIMTHSYIHVSKSKCVLVASCACAEVLGLLASETALRPLVIPILNLHVQGQKHDAH